VGNAAGKGSDGLKLLGLPQFRFQCAPVSDVPSCSLDRCRVSAVPEYDSSVDLGWNRRSVFMKKICRNNYTVSFSPSL
jgi:hypothetical protein